MPKLLFFAGSNGSHSMNAKLALAAEKIAKELGAETTLIDLENYPMPLYDQDIEEKQGFPEAAKTLKTIFQDHDGVFIASPEYNGSFTPLLKNTIDWISRVKEEGEGMLPAYMGKTYAIGSVSPGPLGGIRGLVPLRMLLGNIGIFVTPTQIAVGGGHDAFDENNMLKDQRQSDMLRATITELVNAA